MSAKLFSGKKGASARAQNGSVSPSTDLGIIAEPQFHHSRVLGKTDFIGVDLYAHSVAGGWVATTRWFSLKDSSLSDGCLPRSGDKSFANMPEAIEAALDLALHQVRAQLGKRIHELKLSRQFKKLVAWVKAETEAIRQQERKSLPLWGKTYIDLFSGIGGFAVALDSLGAKRVLSCEKNPQARENYGVNHGDYQIVEDICELNTKGLKADIIVAGAPCQRISIAGNQAGLADAGAAEVFEHLFRIVGDVVPKIVLIENSQQILTLDRGQTAESISMRLMQLGYRVQTQTLNAAAFGLPQDRERAFFVATRLDCKLDPVLGFAFPEGTSPTSVVADILERDVDECIEGVKFDQAAPHPKSREASRVRIGKLNGKTCQGNRVYSPMGLGPTLCASSGGKGRNTGAYHIGGRIRMLTPREAFRMQGVPEWYEPHSSNAQALKQAGNGVAVPVVREIARGFASVL